MIRHPSSHGRGDPQRPGYPELLRAAVAGTAGAVVAWLGAQLTHRREKWSYKRDVYAKILLRLMDVYLASFQRVHIEQDLDPAHPSFQLWLKESLDNAGRAMEELRRDSAIVAIFSSEVAEAIDDLEKEWLRAKKEKTGFSEADRRFAAVQKARAAVVAAAKRDLKM